MFFVVVCIISQAFAFVNRFFKSFLKIFLDGIFFALALSTVFIISQASAFVNRFFKSFLKIFLLALYSAEVPFFF